MIGEICSELRNYFEKNKYKGTFTISSGVISPSDFISNGQYYRIVGSLFNDGVHKHPSTALTDETFDGEVWTMAVPPSVIALADKIAEYANSKAAAPSPYVSESFGGYNYTKANGDASANSWQKVFAKDLNRWRKI